MAAGRMTQTQLIRSLAEASGSNNKATKAFLEILADTAIKETKKSGVFVLPGIGRLVRVDRKALADIQSFIKPNGYLFLFGTTTTATEQLAGPFFAHARSHTLLSQWGSRLQILEKLTV